MILPTASLILFHGPHPATSSAWAAPCGTGAWVDATVWGGFGPDHTFPSAPHPLAGTYSCLLTYLHGWPHATSRVAPPSPPREKPTTHLQELQQALVQAQPHGQQGQLQALLLQVGLRLGVGAHRAEGELQQVGARVSRASQPAGVRGNAWAFYTRRRANGTVQGRCADQPRRRWRLLSRPPEK